MNSFASSSQRKCPHASCSSSGRGRSKKSSHRRCGHHHRHSSRRHPCPHLLTATARWVIPPRNSSRISIVAEDGSNNNNTTEDGDGGGRGRPFGRGVAAEWGSELAAAAGLLGRAPGRPAGCDQLHVRVDGGQVREAGLSEGAGGNVRRQVRQVSAHISHFSNNNKLTEIQ